MKYYVFMVDLVDSRKMDPDMRRICQEKLKHSKDLLNKYLSKQDMKIEFSSGDSLQGFSKDPVLVFNTCILLEHMMYPTELHSGIGNGEIYVIDQVEGSNASDGPAYHSAANSLEISKRELRSLVVSLEPSLDPLINQILTLIEKIRNKNTKKQNFYVSLFCFTQVYDLSIEMINNIISGNRLFSFNSIKDSVNNHASWMAKATGTTLQNAYDMIKKSDAQTICDSYLICIDYLKNISIFEGK